MLPFFSANAQVNALIVELNLILRHIQKDKNNEFI